MFPITWRVLPGRTVAHACREVAGLVQPVCGQCSVYKPSEAFVAGVNHRRCEMCEITMVTQVNVSYYKFFLGHVPTNVRAARRKQMRAFREACKTDAGLAARILQLREQKDL